MRIGRPDGDACGAREACRQELGHDEETGGRPECEDVVQPVVPLVARRDATQDEEQLGEAGYAVAAAPVLVQVQEAPRDAAY